MSIKCESRKKAHTEENDGRDKRLFFHKPALRTLMKCIGGVLAASRMPQASRWVSLVIGVGRAD